MPQVGIRRHTSSYFHVHACRMRHRTQRERVLRHRTSSCIDAHRCTALYARLMQTMLGPKHASNLTNVIPHDKFQPCHWPLLACVALHVLRCVLLEIALNAGSVVLEGAAARRGGVLSCGDRSPPCRAVRSAWIRAVYLRIVSYRIEIFCLVSYRIYRFLLWLYRAITTTVHLL